MSFYSGKHARRALSNTEFLSIPTASGKERKAGVQIDERNDEEEMEGVKTAAVTFDVGFL